MTIQALIDEYKSNYAGSANLSEGLQQHRKLRQKIAELNNPSDEIAAALAEFVAKPCDRDLNFWLESAEIHPSHRYLESLCELLEQAENCIWHEGIIYALEKLNDERSIPSLMKAISHDLNYENTKQVAVAAMEVLGKIGTDEAIEVLQMCRKYPDNLVRRTARMLLKALSEEKDK